MIARKGITISNRESAEITDKLFLDECTKNFGDVVNKDTINTVTK